MSKYKIIYIDCPWTYNDKALAGNRGAECKYPTMNIEAIKSLPINQIADENCVLFCWATWPLIQEALDAIKSWGFKYKTVGFVWVKMNKITPTPFMGMGNWSRSNSEVCLLATKGKPKRVSAGVSSIVLADEDWESETIMAPIEGHSKKPDVFRDKIVALCGDVERTEIFAREAKSGWSAIGNGIDGRDIREVLEELING